LLIYEEQIKVYLEFGLILRQVTLIPLQYRTSKRLQIKHDFEVEIKFCISDEQYMRIAA